MTRIVRIRLTLEVPDDMEVQVNRDEEPTILAQTVAEVERGDLVGEPPLFEGLPTTPIVAPEHPWTENRAMPGPVPMCPRHHKSKEGKGGYYCPTPISAVGVEPKVWCDWRVKIG